MKKLKKILAILLCVLLILTYLATFIFAICNFEGAVNLFKASLYLTVVLPVLLYAFLLVGRHLSNKNSKVEENESDHNIM